MENSKNRNDLKSSENFIWGFGSLLSIFSGYNNRRIKLKLCVSDRDSMKSDWRNIGEDLKRSVYRINVAK